MTLVRFVVSGWPSRKETLPFLKQHYLNPHIIIVFNSLKEKALEEFEKLDPKDDLFCSKSLPTQFPRNQARSATRPC